MRLSSGREKAVRGEVSNEGRKNDPDMGALFTPPLAEVEPRASHIIIDLRYFKSMPRMAATLVPRTRINNYN